MKSWTLAFCVLFLGLAGGCSHAPQAGAPAPGPTAGATVISHVTPGAAESLVREGRATVLDLRTPAEFAEGHIAGAKLIDFKAPDFEQKLGGLDRSKTYLIHCAGGGRSMRSLPVFQKLGFQSIAHLDGGLHAWQEAGKPVEK